MNNGACKTSIRYQDVGATTQDQDWGISGRDKGRDNLFFIMCFNEILSRTADSQRCEIA
jgi:hypothetical protein